jgi:hypothetical protein
LRSVFAEPDFNLLAGFGLDLNQQTAAAFGLTSGATITSAGIGTFIVGLRASLAIIDDPVASRENVSTSGTSTPTGYVIRCNQHIPHQESE